MQCRLRSCWCEGGGGVGEGEGKGGRMCVSVGGRVMDEVCKRRGPRLALLATLFSRERAPGPACRGPARAAPRISCPCRPSVAHADIATAPHSREARVSRLPACRRTRFSPFLSLSLLVAGRQTPHARRVARPARLVRRCNRFRGGTGALAYSTRPRVRGRKARSLPREGVRAPSRTGRRR